MCRLIAPLPGIRFLTVASIIGVIAGAVSPALAADRNWSQCVKARTDGYHCPWGYEVVLVGSPSRQARPSTGRPSSRSTEPEPRVAYVHNVEVGPDGRPCFRRRAIPIPDGVGLPSGTDLGNNTGNILANYSRCPEEPGESQPEIDPRVLAIQGWEEVELPKPQPYIAPGWAITGKTAYLETRGQLTHTFTKDTPIGPLRINSTGAYYVDWGDGTKTGPHDTEGGPWPDGTITHTYIHVGHYDVVVTEEWSADWNLGPAGGRLTGQRTVGRIDDFRVEQIQVVVGRG